MPDTEVSPYQRYLRRYAVSMYASAIGCLTAEAMIICDDISGRNLLAPLAAFLILYTAFELNRWKLKRPQDFYASSHLLNFKR